MFATFLIGAALAAKPSHVNITVVDAASLKPIPNATILFPVEGEQHHVNSFDGSWEATVLYPKDQPEHLFGRGESLDFVVSAPGFVEQKVTYITLGKRMNKVEIALTAAEAS